MKNLLLTVLLFVFAIFSPSCSLNPTIADVLRLKPRIIQTEAKFTKDKTPFIKITETNLPTKEIRSKVIFFDECNWLFIGAKVFKPYDYVYILFKTSDGGKTWQNFEIQTPEDSGINEIFFISPSIGWILLFNNGNSWDENKKAWLMKTTDGGKSWNILKTWSKTTLGAISFIDEKNGWMIANESNLEPTVVTRPIIYQTIDGGETWIDTSEKLREYYNYTDGGGSIVELFAENTQSVKVATHDNKFFKTEDSGKTWKQFGPDLSFFPAQIGIGNLGRVGNSQRLRIGAGGWSVEGHNCYLTSEEKDGSWKHRWIREGFSLGDILYISENELFISGRNQKSLLKTDWESASGVIYYSADGGDTFSTVYETQQAKGFRSMTKISDNHIIAAGDNGLIVNLEIQ